MRLSGFLSVKFILITLAVLFGFAMAGGQCQKWAYSYSPEIKCDYLEYFGLPRQASQICLARQNSKIAPGDYYQEPNLDHFLMADKSQKDIGKFGGYLGALIKDEYICENSADLFEVYLIYGDSVIRMGQYSHQVSYPDSSRREFFGKFTIDDTPIFLSGWFDKFVCLYLNIECESADTALVRAGKYLKPKTTTLDKYSKSVFETTRSDVYPVDSSLPRETAISETRESEFYRYIASDHVVWNVFRKNVALMSGNSPAQQQISGVKQFWVVSITRYIDKQYLPPWLKSPQK